MYAVIGRFFSQRKHFFLLLAFCFLLFFLATYSFFSKIKQFHLYEEKIESTSNFSKLTKSKRQKRHLFLEKYLNANTDFIQNKIEPLVFLESECRGLHSLKMHPAFSNSKFLLERLDFLQNKNTLTFQQNILSAQSHLLEIQNKQIDPIEVNSKDLKHLLYLIEGSSNIKKPQMLIKKFSLKKLQTDTFDLNIEILQRNFTRK